MAPFLPNLLLFLLLIPNGGSSSSSTSTCKYSVDNVSGCDEDDGNVGSFCGVDGKCHLLSCQNFYKYGNANFTGYNNSSSDTDNDVDDDEENQEELLECYTIKEKFLDSTAGIEYRCYDLNPEPIQHGYTRKCQPKNSNSNLNSNYVCYEMDPDTNFEPFVERIESSSYECSSNSSETPKYTYTSSLQYQHPTFGYGGFYQVHNDTVEFNREYALQGTIYSIYSEYEEPEEAPPSSPTEEQQQLPSSPPTTEDESSSSSSSLSSFYFYNCGNSNYCDKFVRLVLVVTASNIPSIIMML